MTSISTYVLATAIIFVVLDTITEATPAPFSHVHSNRLNIQTAGPGNEGIHNSTSGVGSEPETETKSLSRHIRSDPVTNYYDFVINEGSYKFWAVFQVGTAALLIYSAFAAVYYAKYTFATTDTSDYDDDFFRRRSGDVYVSEKPSTNSASSSFLGIPPETFQLIMNAISSKKY